MHPLFQKADRISSRQCVKFVAERRDCDAGRFAKALRGVAGKGLRYPKLIGGEGIQQPGQTA
jgi:hypothetical protein